MADNLSELRASVLRLRQLVASIDDPDLGRPAYPVQWTIADVLSHLGSGAVITRRRLDDTLSGRDTPPDFARGVWDDWNSKSPTAQRDDALAADADLLAQLEATTVDQRERFSTAMGPMTFGFDEFVAMRLSEHVLHTWDVDVADNPDATLSLDAAALIIDNLDLIARFTAEPTGESTKITVATTEPERRFTVTSSRDTVTLASARAEASPDLVLPAEAFVRLVYGRLDPDRTPVGLHGIHLDTLRRIYPGP
jgi:uncharacterized protein (TIGR03083 family)